MRISLYLALTLCAGVVWPVATCRHCPRQGSACRWRRSWPIPALQVRLLLSLPPSVCLQVRFSRSEAWPLSALATGFRLAAGAATTTTRHASRFFSVQVKSSRQHICPPRSSLILHSWRPTLAHAARVAAEQRKNPKKACVEP